MSEKEFEDFKKKQIKNKANRVYTVWRNDKGHDCKTVGPATKCFCDHRYKDHNYIDPKDKRVHCKVPKCPCPEYFHVPVHGSQDFKCLCKHSYKEHDPVSKKCKRTQCACNRFNSSWSCSCNLKFGEHTTIFETHEERVKMGKPVDNIERMIQEFGAPMSVGGMTNFMDMAVGDERFEIKNEMMLEDKNRNLAIKGQNQKQLENKKNKLGNLNSKIMAGKVGKQDEDFEMSQGVMKAYGNVMGRPDEGITALELFMTPHVYVNSKPTGKKALKYK